MFIRGKVLKVGDHTDTDIIIPARYLVTTDAKELGKNVFEPLKKQFEPGDIVVAGDNFGCGSSREHAPLAIKGRGLPLVIARSFARIFYRNAINIGLPILELENTDEISEGDILEVNLDEGIVKNASQNKTYKAQKFPEFMAEIVKSGGLINYIKSEFCIENAKFARRIPLGLRLWRGHLRYSAADGHLHSGAGGINPASHGISGRSGPKGGFCSTKSGL